jgi:hypothetical protein
MGELADAGDVSLSSTTAEPMFATTHPAELTVAKTVVDTPAGKAVTLDAATVVGSGTRASAPSIAKAAAIPPSAAKTVMRIA